MENVSLTQITNILRLRIYFFNV